MKPLPCLRSDLIIKEQTIREVKSYIVKDPEKQRYYRFDEEEFQVFTYLDGKRTAEEVAREYSDYFKEETTADEISEFIASVRSMGLFERTDAEQNTYLYEKLKEQRQSQILQAKGSAFYFRVKIWDPNSFFEKLMPRIEWIWSRSFVMVMNLFMLSGVVLVVRNHEKIEMGMENIFDLFNKDLGAIFLLWATVMGTIMIHELGHGLTCRRFGGECHEIGFLFMFLNPCMYANVNDAWLFEERRHRLYVTAAGCYAEFLIGCICVYIWYFTQPGSLVNVLTFQVVVVSFFAAIFMNFNPLMKFDGYFALSDFLEMPNLRERSKDYVKYLIQSKLFFLDREKEYLSIQERRILFTYGVLMILYLTNVMLGLGFMIGGMLISKLGTIIGGSLTIFVIYKIQWRFAVGFWRFVKVVIVEHEKFFKKYRFLLYGILLLLIGSLAYVYGGIPFARRLEFRGTLEPERVFLIRSLSPGYVLPRKDPNQLRFQTGEVVLKLDNSELELERKNLLLDLEENSVRIEQANADSDMGQLETLYKRRKKLEEQKVELDRQYKNLTVTAPFTGVLLEKLVSFENRYVEQGEEIVKMIDPGSYQSKLDVQERDLKGIQVGTVAKLILDAQPGTLFDGKVSKLSVLHKQQGLARSWQVTVSFPNRDLALRSGMEGAVLLDVGRMTLWQQTVLWVKKTIRLDLQL